MAMAIIRAGMSMKKRRSWGLPRKLRAVAQNTSLGTYPVYAFGSEEQKQEWMPKLTSGDTPLNPYRVLWDLARTVDLDNTIKLDIRYATTDNFVGRPVILHHQRMIHGDICRPLFKITYGIAACRHHIT